MTALLQEVPEKGVIFYLAKRPLTQMRWGMRYRRKNNTRLKFMIMDICTWSVRKVSDLWPGKRNWLTWSVGHLITLKVVPLGPHTSPSGAAIVGSMPKKPLSEWSLARLSLLP